MTMEGYIAQGSLGGNGTILYPQCGGGYINLYLCKNSKNCTLPQKDPFHSVKLKINIK